MLLRGSVYSKTLEMETGLTVLFPKKYEAGKKFRAAYLLHGICSSDGSWVENTMLPVYAGDRDAVIIMPDAVRSLYTDMKYGQKYFSYISEELPEICENTLNISSSREDTAVLGGSAGGYGALRCALSRPEKFSVCCAFSSAFLFLGEAVQAFSDKESAEKLRAVWGTQLPSDLCAAFGENLTISRRDELLALAQDITGEKPKIYLSCGTGDSFYPENYRFAEEMQKLGFSPTIEAFPGTHDWFFFDMALRRGLDFCFK
ncbi:MAG: alpha/beta hydrolase [Oscillospiraceae bacterium]